MTYGLRVALIDSDDFVREGRILLLQSQPTTQIVYESGDPTASLDAVADYLLDVIIVDTRIPGWKAADFLAELSRRLDDAGNDAQILALTAFGSSEFELSCLRAGAAVVVSSEQGFAELLKQIRLVGTRENTIPRTYLEGLIASVDATMAPDPNVARSLSVLDASQIEVIKAMLDGKTDSQISRELDLTRYRVAKFIESLRASSNFRTRQQLAIELLSIGGL